MRGFGFVGNQHEAPVRQPQTYCGAQSVRKVKKWAIVLFVVASRAEKHQPAAFIADVTNQSAKARLHVGGSTRSAAGAAPEANGARSLGVQPATGSKFPVAGSRIKRPPVAIPK